MSWCTTHDCDVPDIADTANSSQSADPDERERAVLMSLLARMQLTTYSTAFSGVDSPGTAFAQLRASLANTLGGSTEAVYHPKHLHAIDTHREFGFDFIF